jgi:CHASE3 domain sensor protein
MRFTVGSTSVLVVLALFGAVAFASVSRLSRQQEAIGDTNVGINTVQDLLVASYEAERSGMDYLQRGSAESMNSFLTARGQIEDALDDLRRRAEDRPRQRAALDTLGHLIGARVGAMSDAINIRKRQATGSAVQVVQTDSTRETRGGMLPLVQRVREEELVVLAERTRLMSRNSQISRMIVLGGSIIAFLVAAVVLVPVRSETT